MAHGSSPFATVNDNHRARQNWYSAIRRGAIAGTVASIHLLAIVYMLRPALPRTWQGTSPPHDLLMQLRFNLLPKTVSTQLPKLGHKPEPKLASHQPHVQATSAYLASAWISSPATTTLAFSTPPTPTTSSYGAGGFMQQLQRAKNATGARLPGSDIPRVDGLALKQVTSARDVVHQLTLDTRCSAERFKMGHSKTQFITRQLRDRALAKDDCLP